DTGFTLPTEEGETSIHDIYAALVADETRNLLILNDLLQSLQEGRSPILLTERREHLEFFASRLAKSVHNVIMLRGGMGVRQRRAVAEQLATIPDSEERVLLATGRYIGEGFDDIRLDTLFLAMPVSWKGTLVQYAGRLHRLHAGKVEVRIYDYVDSGIPMLLRMFQKRLRGYRAMGYEPDNPEA
ncbi:MAG: helicase-related protein, partial [Dehalococcoidia bacterium]